MPAEPSHAALWTPSPEQVRDALLTEFARSVDRDALAYDELHQWSVDQPEEFWSAIWSFGEIIGQRGSDDVLRTTGSLAAAQFFPHATLNAAENLMARLPVDQPAIIAYTEHGRGAAMSAADVRAAVAAVAAALREVSVRPGDRVVVMLPNGPEAIVAMLAATSIGAVFASASPDFGVTAVLDRFGQIEPVVFIGCATYRYAGKEIDCL
ncbi:MAG: AMP-binding protein, partial [Ilumatobacteraceae bacterium]